MVDNDFHEFRTEVDPGCPEKPVRSAGELSALAGALPAAIPALCGCGDLLQTARLLDCFAASTTTPPAAETLRANLTALTGAANATRMLAALESVCARPSAGARNRRGNASV